MTVSFGIIIATTAAALALLMTGTFALAKVRGRHRVVDTAWGIGLAGVPLVALAVSAGQGQESRRILLAAASAVWGARLALYTAWQARGQGEDPRYRDLLRRARGHPDRSAARVIYLPQGLILWLVTMPVQAGMVARRPPGLLAAAGAALWLAGFAAETAGDWQLARFKAAPGNRGALMDRGLWRYTRHPNYFGDACMWWGLFLVSYGGWAWIAAAAAPLAMTYVLVRGTGARLTERRMAGRPGYAAYTERTSGFVPLPPCLYTRLRRRRGTG